jgi:hypothetical protein
MLHSVEGAKVAPLFLDPHFLVLARGLLDLPKE